MGATSLAKGGKAIILASGLIAASSVLGQAQDTPVALGTQATVSLISRYTTTPTGQSTLGGHTFDMTSGNLIPLANGGSANFTGSYQNAKAVYLLLNTANTFSWFAGSVVGTVVLTFSDNTTQSTNLVIGANLREWRIGALGVVNTLTDPATAPVWTTTAQPSMGGGSAVLDMLTVPVASTGKTLIRVTLTDTNAWGGLQLDLAGLTVGVATATPTPTPSCTKKDQDDKHAAVKAKHADHCAGTAKEDATDAEAAAEKDDAPAAGDD